MNDQRVPKPQRRETSSLIDALTRDLPNPSESASWPARFVLVWALAIASYIVSAFVIVASWPDRASLPSNLFDARFLTTSALWLVAFATCARICYLYAMPFSKLQTTKAFAFGAVLLLGIVTLAGEPIVAFLGDFPHELAFNQGPCGFFILLTGVVTGAFVLTTMRRAAASRLSASGAWTLAASGCLSSFFMHLICRHESPAHILLWHVLPIVLIVGLGMKLASVILRD